MIGFILAIAVVVVGEYRSINGYGNNLDHQEWGSTNIRVLRGNGFEKTYPANYADDVSTPVDGASPRLISNRLFAREQVVSKNPISLLHMSWGQFLDHDVTFTPSGNESLPITIPPNDPVFGDQRSMAFTRSLAISGSGTSSTNPRDPLNEQTAYIDGSHIYGWSEEILKQLRNASHPCYLKSTMTPVGEMLPKAPAVESDTVNDGNTNGKEALSNLFLTGDPKGNENPGLAMLHTLFVREHNRLCRELKEKNPGLDGDTWFQEARKWVIAFIQQISFTEYVSSTLGSPLPPYRGYQYSVNSGVDNLFTSASFRYGHSEVAENFSLYTLNETFDGILDLSQCFFSAKCWETKGVEPLLLGLLKSPQMEVDTKYPNALRNMLFGHPSQGGTDLVSRNIQRGRDQGTLRYNDARWFHGLPRITDFRNLTSDPEFLEGLNDLYNGDVNLLDAYVGGLLEDHIEGGSLGELFHRSILDQYLRIRDGDRFYFENTADSGFTPAEVLEIQQTKLSHIILRNTKIQALQCSAFYLRNENDCGNTTTNNMTQSGSILDGFISFNWTLYPNTSQIRITVTGRTNGWLAIGFPAQFGVMTNADVIIGQMINNTFIVKDYWISDSRSYGCPSGVCLDTLLGGTDSIIEYFGNRTSDGVTSFTFLRNYKGMDEYDTDIRPGIIPINLAMGTTDELVYHQQNKGSIKIQLIPTNDTFDWEYRFTPMDGYEIRWKIDNETITFAFVAQNLRPNQFVGIGFGIKTMRGVDIIKCWINDSNIPICQDSYSAAWNPLPDTSIGGTDDILPNSTKLMHDLDTGWPMILCSRKLKTPDSGDFVIPPYSIDVIYSRGNDGLDHYHGLLNRGAGNINFFTGQAVAYDSTEQRQILLSHGLSMVVCWIFLYPAGVYVARYLKHYDWWVRIHMQFQQTGTVSTITFAFLAYLTRSSHWNTPHSALGFFITILLLVQICLGYISDLSRDHKIRRLRRLLITRIHHIFGFALIISAPAQIYLGLQILFPDYSLYENLYIFFVALVCCIFLATELYKRRQERNADKVKLIEKGKYPTYTWVDIVNHVRAGAKWVVIRRMIYDVSSWIENHPGGSAVLANALGTDCTDEFEGRGEYRHKHTIFAWNKLKGLVVGKLKLAPFTVDSSVPSEQIPQQSCYNHFEILSISTITATENPVKLLRFSTSPINFIFNLEPAKDGAPQFDRNISGYDSREDSCAIEMSQLGRDQKILVFPGQYFEVCLNKENKVFYRPYTPIPLYPNSDYFFELYIKIYAKGQMSKFINKLKTGRKIKIRGPLGHKLINKATKDGTWKYVALIAGGTGILPMLHLLHWHLHENKKKPPEERSRIALLNFNRTKGDIFLEDRLREMAHKSEGYCTVIHAVTREDDPQWKETGYIGRPSANMLKTFLSSFPCLSEEAKKIYSAKLYRKKKRGRAATIVVEDGTNNSTENNENNNNDNKITRLLFSWKKKTQNRNSIEENKHQSPTPYFYAPTFPMTPDSLLISPSFSLVSSPSSIPLLSSTSPPPLPSQPPPPPPLERPKTNSPGVSRQASENKLVDLSDSFNHSLDGDEKASVYLRSAGHTLLTYQTNKDKPPPPLPRQGPPPLHIPSSHRPPPPPPPSHCSGGASPPLHASSFMNTSLPSKPPTPTTIISPPSSFSGASLPVRKILSPHSLLHLSPNDSPTQIRPVRRFVDESKSQEILDERELLKQMHIFICGPPGFVQTCKEIILSLNYPPKIMSCL